MSGDQIFVGSVTILLSIATLLAALGYLPGADKLGVASKVHRRYGARGVRLFYWGATVLLLALAVAILRDARPSFAVPDSDRNELSADGASSP
ncbi:hypothetical protein EC9_07740 [Rosistilla ulvae]|uniref:Uncharacterized protein n=1 Tax=Rosistilla ulvae TaxID=1930277 RepID=A0A517LVF8_9BACT|nr:hypothetical protein [Rosistilla ulvae]QDS86602.1 hypothetical protein EC9_07740 [Rosistilla ulvae]